MYAKFLQLGIMDWIKGFVVAAIAAIVTPLLAWLQAIGAAQPAPVLSWKAIGAAALAAGIAYLVKNLLTNSKDQLFKMEPK
jgi:hypothetical protein